ncbi:Phospholipase/carboxylesterase/thioesterase [Ceraceosorus bombacis]|uniref:Phospholipase/carboxylesterase/thioesterase n=1 Tax=Ceraceosorus bombacis TaxID=401625 RepID=A0A0P1BFC1_9BASI|nr:Phospholipase/carboxylesterase/thioesterase [Ceraceosorus bombacis]
MSEEADWQDPLPHAHGPTILVRLSGGKWSRELSAPVGVVLIHGRNETPKPMMDMFCTLLKEGLREEKVEEVAVLPKEDEEQAVVGKEKREEKALWIEAVGAARDWWYPDAHSVTDEKMIAKNAPFIFSALQRIVDAMKDLNKRGVPNDRIVLVGFSQGANLLNTYTLVLLREHVTSSLATELLPVPRHIFPLAGSRFKVVSPFPFRPDHSRFSAPVQVKANHQTSRLKHSIANANANANADAAARRKQINLESSLMCGTKDVRFSVQMMKDVLSDLRQAAASHESSEGPLRATFSLEFDQDQPHIITDKMKGAVLEGVRNIGSSDQQTG